MQVYIEACCPKNQLRYPMAHKILFECLTTSSAVVFAKCATSRVVVHEDDVFAPFEQVGTNSLPG